MGSEAIKVVVLSSLYPNDAKPVFGNFVCERVSRLAAEASIVVIAPVRRQFLRRMAVAREEFRNGLRVFHPRFAVIPGILKWTDGYLFALSVLFAFRRTVREFKPDIVDAHWGYPDGFAAYLLARMFGLPVVITVRGSDVNVFLKERLRGFLLRHCLRRADHVIAVSAALKRVLVENGVADRAISVVRNGVDTSRLFPKDKQEARRSLGLPLSGKIVLCIGNLVAIKGQDILLEAFQSHAKLDEHLVFVGEGEMKAALLSRADELADSVGRRILFAGSQPHDSITNWLAAADVLCLPSRNEGLPNVVLEALACGRPVVATRVGGVAEVMTSSTIGAMVPPEDPGAMGKALRVALDRDWDADAIRREAERFSWEDTVRQCLEVWTRVIALRNEGKR